MNAPATKLCPLGRTVKITPELVSKFQSKLAQVDGGCHIWTGRLDSRKEYGSVNKKYRAHRMAWVITNGPIPDGLFVLHRCDNPPCCNPDHLFLGTGQDNMDDMHRKGRGVIPCSIGEANSSAKLTDEEVLIIRTKRKEEGLTHRALGKLFGVSRRHIGRILSGEKWSHLPF